MLGTFVPNSVGAEWVRRTPADRMPRRRPRPATVGLLLAAGAAWALVVCFHGTNDGVACSPEYEGACVPEGATDVDCSEIQARGFRSVGSDPYNLDSNGDGTVCE